ncbi:MAG: hypothetical protein KDD63_16570, partial [Bacteroidetes bacterium]|nr:hypothetical protein [Bacteroidota bacterium]
MKTKKRDWHIILLIITLIFSLGFRIEHRYFYRNLYLDTEVQMAAAQNWLNGDGFITHEVDSTGWSQTTTRSAHIFMPGYAFALAGLKLLFNDWFRANFVLDVMGLIFIYLALYLFFWKLTGSHFSKSYFLYLLWQAFSPAPMHYLTGSGLWALGILLCGMAAIYLESDKARKNMLSYVGILLIVCTAWIRDAYMLFGLIPVIWFALQYARNRNKTNLFPLIFSVFLFGLSQVLIHGWWHAEASYLPRQAYGFFPGQLLFMDPFPFKTFFYYGIFHEQSLKMWSESTWIGLKIIAGMISITVIGIVLKSGWEVIRKEREDHPHGHSFIILAFIT